MKNIKFIIFILSILIAVTGCKSIKENLTMKKENSTEEFLIQKKNPLVMPPEFNELPKPRNSKQESDEDQDEKIDLSKILETSSKENKTKDDNKNLEKSISNILKKNENF